MSPTPDPDADSAIAQASQLRELLAHVLATHEAEKRSLVHELHGDLGSSLTALNMHLVLLAQKLPPDPALAQRIEKMKALVLAISESNRRIQLGLGPDKLEVFGLKVALQEAADNFQQQHGVACRLSLPDEELAYSAATDLTIFRMIEQALENVARHAAASEVQIVLDDDEDGIQVTVRDNGRGIAPAQSAGLATHGLRTMRERAEFWGGSVRVSEGRNGGTVVNFSLPKNRMG